MEGLSPTLRAEKNDAAVCVEHFFTDNDMAKVYRIRKLTPRECFRLMGLKDTDVDLIQAAGISESQQYKMAGNSIVVQVLEGIFTQMFKAESDTLF
jgi:DNA (cytosine-5)-methyltransferase 1